MKPRAYVARIPFDGPGEICAARLAEIESCKSEEEQIRKRSVWKLLLHALRENGFNPDAMTFFCDGGKWGAQGVEFSLSHSDTHVAVAVGDLPVGIDVEEIARFSPSLTRLLTQRERESYAKLREGEGQRFLAAAWTRKEAAFKREGNFFVETETCGFYTCRVGETALSVCPPMEVVALGGEKMCPL